MRTLHASVFSWATRALFLGALVSVRVVPGSPGVSLPGDLAPISLRDSLHVGVAACGQTHVCSIVSKTTTTTTVQLHNYTTTQLHNYTTTQLHNYTTAHDYSNCTTAQLHN